MDNSPNSVCEAMASGLVVVASNAGGLPSLIKNKFDGFLFDKDDKEGMADCTSSLYDNPEKMEVISKNARNHCL